MSKGGGKFKNIRPSAHDYAHLPKREKDRYDALAKLEDATLANKEGIELAMLKKHETELKLIRLVRRDRRQETGA
jgi:hypothetical protein